MDERPKKRPYERPTLEGASVFGAEAMTGSCCRNTVAACSVSARNAERITIDASKNRASSTS